MAAPAPPAPPAAPAELFTPQVTEVGTRLNKLLRDIHQNTTGGVSVTIPDGEIQEVRKSLKALKDARNTKEYKSIYQILKSVADTVPANHLASKFLDQYYEDPNNVTADSKELNNIVKSMNVHLVDYLLDNLVNSYTAVTTAIDTAKVAAAAGPAAVPGSAAALAAITAPAEANNVALKFAKEFSIFKKGVERLVGGSDSDKVINPTNGTQATSLIDDTVAYIDNSNELAAINAFITTIDDAKYAGGNGNDYSTKVLNMETSQKGGSDVGNLAEIYNSKALITDDHSPSSVIGSADVNSVQYAPPAFSAGMSLSQDLAGGIAVEDAAANGGSVHEILSPVSVQSAGGAGKKKKTSHKKKNAGEEITKTKKKKKSVSKK